MEAGQEPGVGRGYMSLAAPLCQNPTPTHAPGNQHSDTHAQQTLTLQTVSKREAEMPYVCR